ncbi:hypothetical protein GOV10_06505 [Candidatus Woesearchaeota archaeon]|nr:hypothetical protein [Candidatus Woesearchaeota archaeon]
MEQIHFQAKVKKWGQSMAIILPKQEAKEAGFAIGDEVTVEMKSKFKLSDIWGKLPNMEEDTGKTMDEIFKEMKEDTKSEWD